MTRPFNALLGIFRSELLEPNGATWSSLQASDQKQLLCFSHKLTLLIAEGYEPLKELPTYYIVAIKPLYTKYSEIGRDEHILNKTDESSNRIIIEGHLKTKQQLAEEGQLG